MRGRGTIPMGTAIDSHNLGLTSYPSVSPQHYGAGRHGGDRPPEFPIFSLHAMRLHEPVHASYELILVRLNHVSLRVIVGANAVGSLGAGIA